MKARSILCLSLFAAAALQTALAGSGAESAAQSAGEAAAAPIHEKKILVAVKTDDVDLQEIDLSDLQPGDSETIMTESGKTIDLLRTEDDVEIYIDGERLDIARLHGKHGAKAVRIVDHKVEVVCDGDEECDHMMLLEGMPELPHDAYIGDGGDHEGSHAPHKVVIVRKEVTTD
jgi:hypothetical protein